MMLYPDDLKGITDEITRPFNDVEEEAIIQLVALLMLYDSVSAVDIATSAKIVEQLVEDVINQAVDELNALFDDVVEKSIANDSVIYRRPNELNALFSGFYDIKKVQCQASQELINAMENNIGFTRVANGKVHFDPIYETYNRAVYEARMAVSGGGVNYEHAIRNAIKQVSASGLRVVNYDSGVTNHIDVAIRRAVMTGINQMSADMNDQTIKELKADYVETTAHSGARPDHIPWQGRVFKINGSTSEYPNLYKETRLGEVDGLCGANCRHNYYAFFPEFSRRAYSDEELKSIDNPPFEYKGRTYTAYEATQRQRVIETSIRRTKRELIGYKAAGDDEAFTIASIKLNRQREEYKSFSRAAGLPEQNGKTFVSGFGRSEAASSRAKKGL